MFVTALILPSAMMSARSRDTIGADTTLLFSLLQEMTDKRIINKNETIFLKF